LYRNCCGAVVVINRGRERTDGREERNGEEETEEMECVQCRSHKIKRYLQNIYPVGLFFCLFTYDNILPLSNDRGPSERWTRSDGLKRAEALLLIVPYAQPFDCGCWVPRVAFAGAVGVEQHGG